MNANSIIYFDFFAGNFFFLTDSKYYSIFLKDKQNVFANILFAVIVSMIIPDATGTL